MPPVKPLASVLICLILWLLGLALAANRVYYIGSVEEYWDYAPTGMNQITGKNLMDDEIATTYMKRGPNRIGQVYKKAIFKQFTNELYSEEVAKPSWLGFLGPLLTGEEQDTIIVHFKNFASRPYSVHPHGVLYDKESEGALYRDGTSGKSKEDDYVLPGTNYTYFWPVSEHFALTPADPPCLTWMYHSHINTPQDISSGLLGPLLICKKGVSDNTSASVTDNTKRFSLMFSTIDENLSWYLDENIDKFCFEPSTVDKNDEGFRISNLMHSINGYMFGNLPGLEMNAGDLVSWHLIGMGSEIDIHTVQFFDHTLLNKEQRTDVICLLPATLVTAEMLAENVGKWLVTCHVNQHLQAGMSGFYNVKSSGQSITVPSWRGQTRRYFIAAEQILWDYGPGGINKFTGQPLNAVDSDSAPFFTQGSDRIGGTYWKVHYVAYADGNFSRRKELSEAYDHLGILGPVIKAEVGDTILVRFFNNGSKNHSMLPHGVTFSKFSEGAPYADGYLKPGASVKPGDIFDYEWKVPESVGPTDDDPACLTYLYYSATDPVIDTESGLVGPLIICKKNTLNPDGTQKGIDKEFYLLFTIFDENLSFYLDANIDAFTTEPSKVNKEDKNFQESNQMHAVNGYTFGTLPGLRMCQGDFVSWHMIGLGSIKDVHGVNFEGNTIRLGGTIRDTLALLSHVATTVLMQPDQAGTFPVVCRTLDHFTAGMKQLYDVELCGEMSHDSRHYGTVRTYYIAAEEVEWDYAPDKSWAEEKKKERMNTEKSSEHIFGSQGAALLGSKYTKVVYREYENGEFSKQKRRTEKDEHLQILGPLIHGEVGDSILIIFKNKASRPYSIAAHGIQEDRTLNPHITMPGETSTYQWRVPERSGPGVSNPNCIPWAYYSAVHYVKDLYSGLIGLLIICRKGILNEKGLRSDIDREFALLFLVFDENHSWYINNNTEKYLHKNPEEFDHNRNFTEANLMHAINGKIELNLQGLIMDEGDNTDWYLVGMGTEIDVHTVHFHGENFIFKINHEHKADVYDLFPVTLQTVELIAFNPGTWLLHCHVHDHMIAGMEATYTIRKTGNSRTEIKLSGKTSALEEASSVLKALFLIGLVLLLAVMTYTIILACQTKKVYYHSIGYKCESL